MTSQPQQRPSKTVAVIGLIQAAAALVLAAILIYFVISVL